jgi:S-adenosylmethionine hydrolase
VSNSIITLLTDFGDRDVYVGVMKGAIVTINPQLKVVDLTHRIPPQNLWAARFALLNAYPYFPKHTVHLAVVDPGVGSSRRGIAIEFEDGYVVCPDNGLCSGLNLHRAIAAVELTNPQYWRGTNPSYTFHGRDIFAPVAAHLASGVALEQLGTPIDPDSIVRLNLPSFKIDKDLITGCIQYIDRFGNLITNIDNSAVEEKSWQIIVKDVVINVGKTYSDVPKDRAVALKGSHGWIEIAVNGGSAADQLKLTWKDTVKVKLNS